MRWELSEAGGRSRLEVPQVQRSHVESMGEKGLVGNMLGGLGEGLAAKFLLFSSTHPLGGPRSFLIGKGCKSCF